MKTLEFGIGTPLSKILSTLKGVEDADVTLIIPKESPLLENSLNIKILEEIGSSLGKKIQFAEGIVLPPTHATEAIHETAVSEEQGFKINPGVAAAIPAMTVETTRMNILPLIRKMFGKNTKYSVIGLVLVLVLLTGMGMMFLGSITTAKVKLFLDSQPLTQEVNITGSADYSQIDVDRKQLPLTIVSASKAGSDSAKATGKKNVGTPAKGTLTLRNYNTITDKTFSKGTILKGYGGTLEGAKYQLEQTITVPHATTTSRIDSNGTKINETNPGRREITVASVEVGDKYNAKTGQLFVIGTEGYENVNAVADQDLSGGTSKEVVVISDADVKSLTEKLTKSLTEGAKSEANAKISADQKLVDDASGGEVEVLKKELSTAVGTENSTVTLTLEVEVSYYVYNQKDLESLITQAVGGSIPEGYELGEGGTIGAEVVRKTDREIILLGKVDGNAVTKVNKEDLVNNLKDKSISQAENYLRGQGNIQGFEIILSPTLPAFLNKMPSSPSKIQIEVVKQS